MESCPKTVWELLWDYDPNGLVVVTPELVITLVNTAFCEMFHTTPEELIGRPVSILMEDVEDFRHVWATRASIRGKECEYPRHHLVVKKVMFAIPDQGILACILVDITHENLQRRELRRLKEETLRNVGLVVDKHMQVAQEIAGLLGETTAQTKVQLLRLADMLKKETL